ncbi:MULTISPECIES: ABC transporter ATP-binding protein [Brevibacterium]|uniref:ABC transporter ATP-binding protein n=1 Tax=Brevibacterium salitolerans TaxID=1403566 RepID=A0ABN2WTE5_9MICO|nr:ABC transporter ATP-binding protein [Brevibacterium sp.]
MDLLEVDDLAVSFADPKDPDSVAPIVKGVSFGIAPGEVFGLVGESGSGKSVTALSIMGLLDPRTARTAGSVRLQGEEILHGGGVDRSLRGARMSMVFQEPMTALDPVFTIGSQLVETLRAHQQVSVREARRRSVEMLDAVGIVDPAARFHAYPHELSGGMRQRVVIALALICGPELLIADEPTTAVDATVQLQLLRLIREACTATGTAVLFITHDLGVVSQLCDRMATMYAGEIVETGAVGEVLSAPRHPYTAALLGALPLPSRRGHRLMSIPGRVPVPGTEPSGCWFADRCAFVADECRTAHPPLQTAAEQADDRAARCIRVDAIADDLTALAHADSPAAVVGGLGKESR